MVMQLMVMMLDALQVMVMAQLMVVVVSRCVLSVRDGDGSVVVHRSAAADSGHQIL